MNQEDVLFCPVCGKTILSGAKFCRYCGANLSLLTKQEETAAAAETQKEAPTEDSAAPTTVLPVFTEDDGLNAADRESDEESFTEAIGEPLPEEFFTAEESGTASDPDVKALFEEQQRAFEASRKESRQTQYVAQNGGGKAPASSKKEKTRRGTPIWATILITLAGMLLTFLVTVFVLLYWRMPISGDSFVGNILKNYGSSQPRETPKTPGTQQGETTKVGDTEVPPHSNVTIHVDGANQNSAAAVYAKAAQSVVGIRIVSTSAATPWASSSTSTVSEGSGVILTSDGRIITNQHVIDDAVDENGNLRTGYEIRVFLDKSLLTYETATVVGVDETTDLAVIQISAAGLVPIEFADSSTLALGDVVYAIGSPGGLEFMNSISNGIVSGINRNIATDTGVSYDLIQTNTAINPGNSGGALLNAEGKLVGICELKIVSEGFEGMGFAISSNTAKTISDTLMDKGRVSRPQLGITVYTAYNQTEAESAGLPAGAWVEQVTPGSCADKAGVRPNMIITEIDGVPITDYYGLRGQLLKHNAGDKITLKVYSYTGNNKAGGTYKTLTVVLDEAN